MPEILTLYLNGGTLSHVRDTMARKYGFQATEQTYKRKLAARGARKNLTLAQKLRFLNLLNSKDPRSTRLRRPVVKKGVRLYLHAAAPADTRFRCFSPSNQVVEQVISFTEQYYSNLQDSSTDWEWSIAEPFNVFRRALSQTRKNANNSSQVPGIAMLNKACELAPSILNTPLQAIVLFAAYFSQLQWTHMPEARHVTLNYFATYARIIRNDRYLADVLIALKDDDTSNAIGSFFLSIATRYASNQCSGAFVEYLVDSRALAIETGHDRGPAIGELIENILATEKRPLPEIIRLSYARAYLCFWEQDFTGAQKWNTQVLQLIAGDKTYWKGSRGALFQLGRISQLNGRLDEATTYYWQGLEIALSPEVQVHKDPSDRFISLEFLGLLKHLYEELGKSEELSTMHVQFGELWRAYAKEFDRIPPVDVPTQVMEKGSDED